MGKILVFLVTVPVLCIMLFKTVAFFEFDSRQRYLKDLVDDAVFKVRLTGVFTPEDYDDFAGKLSGIGIKAVRGNGIIMKKGYFSGGQLADLTDYTPGESLKRGDVFMLLVVSANPSKLSNFIFGDSGHNGIFYRAKAFCRVEFEG